VTFRDPFWQKRCKNCGCPHSRGEETSPLPLQHGFPPQWNKWGLQGPALLPKGLAQSPAQLLSPPGLYVQARKQGCTMTQFPPSCTQEESNIILSSQVPLSVHHPNAFCCCLELSSWCFRSYPWPSPLPFPITFCPGLPSLLKPLHGQQLTVDCGEQSAALVGTGLHKEGK